MVKKTLTGILVLIILVVSLPFAVLAENEENIICSGSNTEFESIQMSSSTTPIGRVYERVPGSYGANDAINEDGATRYTVIASEKWLGRIWGAHWWEYRCEGYVKTDAPKHRTTARILDDKSNVISDSPGRVGTGEVWDWSYPILDSGNARIFYSFTNLSLVTQLTVLII